MAVRIDHRHRSITKRWTNHRAWSRFAGRGMEELEAPVGDPTLSSSWLEKGKDLLGWPVELKGCGTLDVKRFETSFLGSGVTRKKKAGEQQDICFSHFTSDLTSLTYLNLLFGFGLI